jgi:hypothetical protein
VNLVRSNPEDLAEYRGTVLRNTPSTREISCSGVLRGTSTGYILEYSESSVSDARPKL